MPDTPTTNKDRVVEFVNRHRTIFHFLVAFIGAVVTALSAGTSLGVSAIIAVVPGALAVAFRKVFPNLGEIGLYLERQQPPQPGV